jgi:hypothetical protein
MMGIKMFRTKMVRTKMFGTIMVRTKMVITKASASVVMLNGRVEAESFCCQVSAAR